MWTLHETRNSWNVIKEFRHGFSFSSPAIFYDKTQKNWLKHWKNVTDNKLTLEFSSVCSDDREFLTESRDQDVSDDIFVLTRKTREFANKSYECATFEIRDIGGRKGLNGKTLELIVTEITMCFTLDRIIYPLMCVGVKDSKWLVRLVVGPRLFAHFTINREDQMLFPLSFFRYIHSLSRCREATQLLQILMCTLVDIHHKNSRSRYYWVTQDFQWQNSKKTDIIITHLL